MPTFHLSIIYTVILYTHTVLQAQDENRVAYSTPKSCLCHLPISVHHGVLIIIMIARPYCYYWQREINILFDFNLNEKNKILRII